MAKKRLPPTPEDLRVWRTHMGVPDAGADEPAPVVRKPARHVAPAGKPKAAAPARPDLGRTPARRMTLPKVTPPPAERLDPHEQKAIRRGHMAVEARIDLHGMTQVAAHRRLTKFLLDAWEDGRRVVLVITGKGAPKTDPDNPFSEREPGVLRRALPDWLASPELAPIVVGSEAAQPKDGGSGARYVRLRRKRT